MNAVAGVILIIGIIVLLAAIIILLVLPKVVSKTPTTDFKTPNRSKELSTEYNREGVEDDVPPSLLYTYTENSSEIGMYRESNRKCFHGPGSAFSNIRIHDQDIFVNRDVELKTLTKFRYQSKLHDISGPPGFGKSRLAIHWGHMVVVNGTDVRYENVRDSVLQTVKVSQSTMKGEPSLVPAIHGSTELVDYKNDFPYSSKSRYSSRVYQYNTNLMEQLINWSKDVKCPTVLILDNADDIMHSQEGRGAEKFFENLKSMVNSAHGNLDIVVTSEYKFESTQHMKRLGINNLSLDSSVELIMKSTNDCQITEQDAKQIAYLVGGCPLALKIVIGLFSHNDNLTDVDTLIEDLQEHPMKPLNSPDDIEERLNYTFNISFAHLEQMQLHDCAFYTSLFPGSFSEDAGNAILLKVHQNQEKCHRLLVKHSLLEKYFAGRQRRYEMHRLIREYSRDRGHNKSVEFQKRFKESFSKFYTRVFIDHALFIKHPNSSVLDEHNFNQSLERLNMQYLLRILLSKDEHSLEELQVLAFATSTGLLNSMAIEVYYHEFVNKMNEVCHVLSETDCKDLYIDIVSYTLHHTCNASTLADHIRALLTPCDGIFKCSDLQALHKRRDIWIRLKPAGHAQIYLRHLEMSYCKPFQLTLFHFHFPWPALILIAFAELAVMPTIVKNPHAFIKLFFVIASSLCVLDTFCLGYTILWSYPDQHDVVESCIACIGEISIYLSSFVIFIPRVFTPNCRMYREQNVVTRSRVSYSFLIVLIHITGHYAVTAFPNVLSFFA